MFRTPVSLCSNFRKFDSRSFVVAAAIFSVGAPGLSYNLPDDDILQLNLHPRSSEVSQLSLAQTFQRDNPFGPGIEDRLSLYWLALISGLDGKTKRGAYFWLMENAPFSWANQNSHAVSMNNAYVLLINEKSYALAVKKFEMLVQRYPNYQLGPDNLRVAKARLKAAELRAAPERLKPAPDDVIWDRYMDQVQRRIRRNWFPPKLSHSVEATADFKIDKNGKVLSKGISKSSSISEYDAECLRALELSEPFEELPSIAKPPIEIRFTFSYNNPPREQSRLVSEKNMSPQIRDDNFPTSKVLSYNSELDALVRSKWALKKGKNTASIVILFSIKDDGGIKSLRVHKSSGNPKTDSLAIETIKSCAPLPPPPKLPNNIPFDLEYTFEPNQ